MEKPRVTEIQVRMDCNGCVQKIKKALHGVTGIYDLYIDFPQQKVTVVGCADPEKIVKAIKKTRKSAVICLHSEQFDQEAQRAAEPKPESRTPAGGPLPSESTEQPEAEEVQSPMEGQNEEAPPTSQQDNLPPELTTPPEPATPQT